MAKQAEKKQETTPVKGADQDAPKEKKPTAIQAFNMNMMKYEKTVAELLGTKYGITAQEFMVKVLNAVKKTPKLLQCEPASLFGSILYFAEVGLPFNTPEGFGYILPFSEKGKMMATPIIGYKGLVEIAYRNNKMKSLRIESVYENDEFDYAYGTEEYIKHKPSTTNRGKLVAVYAVAKMEGIDPLFKVVHKDELDKIQKLSQSGSSKFSAYNNGTDVFNIMQAKVAMKLLFKTLPKTDNEALIKVLEMDNKFDYERARVLAGENGYELVESAPKANALEEADMPDIQVEKSEDKIAMEKAAEEGEQGEMFN